jgi:rhomboid family GlyGly-CTERM serine protease
VTPGARRWLGLAGLAAAAALAGWFGPQHALDWQPGLADREPWRMLTAAAVHYSGLHLAANLAGAALVGALGVAARVSTPAVWAWAAAWPLTHAGLALRPDLPHYGGLSGVLHAGAAVAAVHLVASGPRWRRAVGLGLLAGLLIKVWSEAPGGAALHRVAGWDIATAPFAHATGIAAGLACALIAIAWFDAVSRAGRRAASP